MDKVVYSINEVAELLGLSRSYTYELLRKGVIPYMQLGSKRVIPKERFHDWLKGQMEA